MLDSVDGKESEDEDVVVVWIRSTLWEHDDDLIMSDLPYYAVGCNLTLVGK